MAVSVGVAPAEAKLSDQVRWIGVQRLFSEGQLQSENTQALKAEDGTSFGGSGSCGYVYHSEYVYHSVLWKMSLWGVWGLTCDK